MQPQLICQWISVKPKCFIPFRSSVQVFPPVKVIFVTTYLLFFSLSASCPSMKRLDVIWQSFKRHGPQLKSLVHLQLLCLDWHILSRYFFVFFWVCDWVHPPGLFSKLGPCCFAVGRYDPNRSFYSFAQSTEDLRDRIFSVCLFWVPDLWLTVRTFSWACVCCNSAKCFLFSVWGTK